MEFGELTICTLIRESLTASITCLKLCLNSNVSDGYTWKGKLDAVYTVKAGYKWLCNIERGMESDVVSNSWNWIWIIHEPEKIKFFLWIAKHESLPTRAMLNTRGMINSAVCPQMQCC